MKSAVLLLLVLMLATLAMPTHAQDTSPVVYAILFYSPTCPHCHQFITEDLPPIQERFGDQLQVLFVDVSQTQGAALFQAAINVLDFPEGRAGYVPTMLIGETVMIGGDEIPSMMPTLVSDGLAAGGIGLPPVPEIQAAMQGSLNSAASDGTSGAIQSTYTEEQTWQDRFANDSTGNGLAVAVLGLLVFGLVMQIGGEIQTLRDHKPSLWQSESARRWVVMALAALSTGVVVTLVLENGEFSVPTLLAVIVAAGLVGIVWRIWQGQPESVRQSENLLYSLIPVIAVLGMIVAGYLAYIEIREDEAVCGAVGDCNSVQQSDYARLFGVLPIGVLGLIGYVAILGAWWLSRRPTSDLAPLAHMAGLAMAIGGVGFSVYLTFLEPFVIGATCAWCLTSALLMLLILLLQAPQGWHALNAKFHPKPVASRRHL